MDPVLPRDVAAVAALLRSIAAQPPDNPQLDSGPWDFLQRVSADDQESLVRPALHQLLDDADARVRLRALGSLMSLPDRPETVERLIELARGRATRFSGIEVDGERLGERMSQALAQNAVTAGRAREITGVMHTLAGNDFPGESGASLIAAHDPDWAVDLARRFAQSRCAPGFWASLAGWTALYQRDRLLPLLTALAPLPPDDKPAVLAEIGFAKGA